MAVRRSIRPATATNRRSFFDDRAIELFDEALVDAGFTREPLRTVLHDYFAWATRVSMNQYHASADDVPPGMRVPHWSWEGLIRETANSD